MIFAIIFAVSIGSVAHGYSVGSYKVKAYDDICPLLAGVPWVQSPERPNEEGLWFPIAAHENPVEPPGLTCPKESYVRNNATYQSTFTGKVGGAEIVQTGLITLENSEVGLVGELVVGANKFRIQCVDIEYDTWAILYVCGNEVGQDLDFEMFTILSRHRTLDQGSFSKAKAVIKKHGGDPNTLVEYNQSGCE